MARAAEAPACVALWQLILTFELGLCFPNTKTSNAMAFLNLQTPCSRRGVLQLWQVCTLNARRKLFLVPKVTSSDLNFWQNTIKDKSVRIRVGT